MTLDEKKVYDKALQYATAKHAGQTRFCGEPFITHPVAVSDYLREKGYGIEYLVAALFHDLLEDTDASEAEIKDIGGIRVLEAVRLLTKGKNYDMERYISGIKNNPIALAVKGSDRLHNLKTALCLSDKFKRKYIKETEDWYISFLPEIRGALDELKATLS